MVKQPSKKKASSTESVEAEAKVIIVNDDYPTLYSNHVQVSWTGLEVEIIFGEIKESDGQETKIKRNIGIYLSPIYAKAVAASLVDSIKNYEKQFGKISVLELASE